MVTQVQLSDLVDMALCEPDRGCVNFNHLGLLLHKIIDLINHPDTLVSVDTTIRGESVKVYQNHNQPALRKQRRVPSDSVILSQDEALPLEEEVQKSVSFNKNATVETKISDLEVRVKSIEKEFVENLEFPSNHEIINEKFLKNGVNKDHGNHGNQVEVKNQIDESTKKEQTIGSIWHHRKVLKRVEAVEEGVDKLFSIIDEGFNNTPNDNGPMLADQLNRNMSDLRSLQLRLDETVSELRSNEALTTKCSDRLVSFDNALSELSTKNVKDLDELKEKLESEVVRVETLHTERENKIEVELEKTSTEQKVQEEKLKEMYDMLQTKADHDQIKEMAADMARIGDVLNQQSKLERLELEHGGKISELGKKMDLMNIGTDDTKFDELFKKITDLEDISHLRVQLNENSQNIKDILKKIEHFEQEEAFQDEIWSKLDDFDRSLATTERSTRTLEEVMALLQQMTEKNTFKITDLNTLCLKLQEQALALPVSVPSTNNGGKKQEEYLQKLQQSVLTLQGEQVKQSTDIFNVTEDYKSEFERKQLHIDALYDYIDKLQNAKADKDDVEIEIDVKADKKLLDNKVSLNMFDERYQALSQTLRDALNRLDQYVEEEDALKSEFSKLSMDMSLKMDTEAGRKLKKFLDKRLKEIQESRKSLPESIDKAAGMRRPMPLSYNCLSCDRPLEVTERGVLPPVPNNLPSKSALGSSGKRDPCDESVSRSTSRFCGGSHTSVNINMLRMQKSSPLLSECDITTTDDEKKDSVADCVLGNDGQIYRGRFPPKTKSNSRSSSRKSLISSSDTNGK